ncbi:MAG: serine/threonine-protein kinase [Kiritimatiellia bacterium]
MTNSELAGNNQLRISGYDIQKMVFESSLVQLWEVHQLSLDRDVYLLNLREEHVGVEVKVSWFQDLVRFVARLHHSSFIQIIDISAPEANPPYVILERLDGMLLSDLLAAGPLEPDRAALIVRTIAEGLDAAWKHSGFIHRNLKPQCIYVTESGNAKIFRFVTGTFIRPGANPYEHDDDMLVGTPNYMSPEQIEGSPSIDFHTDMYALGALFYEMVTGKTPFKDEKDPVRVLAYQQDDNCTIPSPSDVNPAIPLSYSMMIQKMMAKRLRNRYNYWQDVIEDIERIRSGRLPYMPDGKTWIAHHSTVASPRKADGVSLVASAGGVQSPVPRGDSAAFGKTGTRKISSGKATAAVAAAPAREKPKTTVVRTAPEKNSNLTGRGSSAYSNLSVLNEQKAARPTIPFFLRAGVTLLSILVLAIVARWQLKRLVSPQEPIAGNLEMLSNGDHSMSLSDGEEEQSSVVRVEDMEPVPSQDEAASIGATQSADTSVYGGDTSSYASSSSYTPAETSTSGESGYSSGNSTEAQVDLSSQGSSSGQSSANEKEILLDLYGQLAHALRTGSLQDAKVKAQTLFRQAAQNDPAHVDLYKRCYKPFREAVSWEDLVGLSLTATPIDQEVTCEGHTLRIRPLSYARTVLTYQRKRDGQTVTSTLSLSRMSAAEKWSVMRHVPESQHSQAEKYSRALLIYTAGTGAEFKSFVQRHNIQELKPLFRFLD